MRIASVVCIKAFAVFLAAAGIQCAAIAQGVGLFAPANQELRTAESAVINELSSRATTKRIRVVEIDSASFEQSSIVANCFDDFSEEYTRQRIGHKGTSLSTWTGNQPDALGSAAFVINGNRISGHIVSPAGNYEVIPLDDFGRHAVIEHDISKFGACGEITPRPVQQLNPEQGQTHHQPLRISDENECFIRVIVAYTAKAQDSVMAVYGRTMIEHINLAVVETNQGYANSGVDQRIELAYLYQTTDDESDDSQVDVDDLRDTSDGRWDEIHMYRDMYHADMVCLISGGEYEGICGRAYGFDYDDPNNMFQVTEFDCAVGNYTFAHEFGHLQGCRHNIDFGTSPFSDGHGYNQGTVFRTIMAVCCTPVRVNYWSNPYKFYPGAGPMGSLNFSNNARALNEGDSTVAMHRHYAYYQHYLRHDW